jgi:hypothetical protein
VRCIKSYQPCRKRVTGDEDVENASSRYKIKSRINNMTSVGMGNDTILNYFLKKKVDIFLICLVFTSFLAALLTRLFSLATLAALILTNISLRVSSLASVFSTFRAATIMAAVNCCRYKGVGWERVISLEGMWFMMVGMRRQVR